MLVRGYRLSVISCMRPGDLMYNVVIIVNNIYLNFAGRVHLNCSHHKNGGIYRKR